MQRVPLGDAVAPVQPGTSPQLARSRHSTRPGQAANIGQRPSFTNSPIYAFSHLVDWRPAAGLGPYAPASARRQRGREQRRRWGRPPPPAAILPPPHFQSSIPSSHIATSDLWREACQAHLHSGPMTRQPPRANEAFHFPRAFCLVSWLVFIASVGVYPSPPPPGLRPRIAAVAQRPPCPNYCHHAPR